LLTVNLDGQYFSQIADPAYLPQMATKSAIDLARFTIPADELAAYQAEQDRKQMRAEIEPVAGDIASLLGTTADATGLLLESVGNLAKALLTSSDPVVAAAAEPVANALAPLLVGIDNGSIKLTHHVKGTVPVVTEIGTKATAVSTVLEAHANPE